MEKTSQWFATCCKIWIFPPRHVTISGWITVGINFFAEQYTHCAHILYNVDSLSTVSTLARARALRPGRGFFASIKDHGCAVGGWKAGPANGEQARAHSVHERRPNDNRTQAQQLPSWRRGRPAGGCFLKLAGTYSLTVLVCRTLVCSSEQSL